MNKDLIKKEALFNEVKGSLFEYLVAKEIAIASGFELSFQNSLDSNYLNVLSQQDRMVRQFYPDMLPFLISASRLTSKKLLDYLEVIPRAIRLVGKFSNSTIRDELQEADILLEIPSKTIPVSLKLNKKNAFVNTKSGGIKSFLTQYFPFLNDSYQVEFNRFVDQEFLRMSLEIHDLNDLDFPGDFSNWVANGLSELPGELDDKSRNVLKRYYSRIASRLYDILNFSFEKFPSETISSLPTIMGFSSDQIIQVTYFHTLPDNLNPSINIHKFEDLFLSLENVILKPFGNISSVEFQIGDWELQIRIKPMNKFTTSAMKMNCSIRAKPSVSF